jgi:hypothetical protein
MEELVLKELTWHSARLTFSILLQDAGVDPATVALLLGHTTSKHVLDAYKRHRPKNQLATIVRSKIFSYIETWYNKQRKHSALQCLSPSDYEFEKENLSLTTAA